MAELRKAIRSSNRWSERHRDATLDPTAFADCHLRRRAKGDKGEPGTNGKDGTNGVNGLGWTYGHGVPTSTSQPVGSLYLDLDTGNVYAFNA